MSTGRIIFVAGLVTMAGACTNQLGTPPADAGTETTAGTAGLDTSTGLETPGSGVADGPAADATTGTDDTTGTTGTTTGSASTSDTGGIPAGTTTDSTGTDTGSPHEGSRVFVTSTKYDGDLGGLVGGDARCQEQADAAMLGGSWLAWLGDGTDGPATRFVQSKLEYRRVSGELIAENWDDLIDGTITVPINVDETGTPLPDDDDMIVWTAVFHTGGNPTPVNCDGWTTAAETLVPTGLATATDTGWTVTAPRNCSEMHRLYCFEQ